MEFRSPSLIEILLLMFVALILAAIGGPAFLEADERSKMAQARSNMRSAATVLEAYFIDFGAYPFDGYQAADTERYNEWFLPVKVTTPISYVSSLAVLDDPFVRSGGPEAPHWQHGQIRYRNTHSTWGIRFADRQSPAPGSPSPYYEAILQYDFGGWSLVSVGPDGHLGPSASSPEDIFPGAQSWPTPSGYPDHAQPYDPTNGTTSWGDILRSQKHPAGYPNVQ